MDDTAGPRRPDDAGGDLPPGWEVVPMEPGHLDEVLEIERASFSNPWTRQMFEGELANAGVAAGYVLRTPEWPVVAFCTIWLVADEVHINNVAVRPQCRRAGAGRRLLETVLRSARDLGARRATLEVRRSNVGAIKLYERMGFQVRGLRRDYYSNPVEDGLVLWLDELGAGAGPEGERPA